MTFFRAPIASALTDSDGYTAGTATSPIRTDPTGTTVQPVSVVSGAVGGGPATVADGADVAEGSTADTAWVSGSGTVISLLKKIANAGGSAVSIADGSDAAEGATTDAAVTSDASGTLSGKLRGLVKIFADVWDSVNHRLRVDGSGVTQPVSGTFFQATQPISGTVTANQGGTWTVQPGNTANTTAWKVDGSAVTQPVSGTVAVTPPTLTKATQGATGFSVQNLKDAGRTYVTLTLDAVAGVTVEALASAAINKAETTSSATSYTVTTGKTLRIQGFAAQSRATTTTALTAARVRLRTAASAIAASSPVLATLDCTPPTAAALAGATGSAFIDFPDGLEIAGTHQIALSQVISSTSSAVSATVVGYEY